MERKTERTAILITLLCTAAVIVAIFAMGRALRNAARAKGETSWVLRSYGNGVALYQGRELSAVYGSVVLDDLPPEDVKLLQSGISFSTREEAEQAMEDYE